MTNNKEKKIEFWKGYWIATLWIIFNIIMYLILTKITYGHF